jgi:hypothetical protein
MKTLAVRDMASCEVGIFKGTCQIHQISDQETGWKKKYDETLRRIRSRLKISPELTPMVAASSRCHCSSPSLVAPRFQRPRIMEAANSKSAGTAKRSTTFQLSASGARRTTEQLNRRGNIPRQAVKRAKNARLQSESLAGLISNALSIPASDKSPTSGHASTGSAHRAAPSPRPVPSAPSTASTRPCAGSAAPGSPSRH